MLTDLRLFGTAEHPLRASGLPQLVECNWRAIALAHKLLADSSGAAADTGTAVHRAIQLWHSGTVDPLGRLPQYSQEFPLADLDDAGKQFRAYEADPRNQGKPVLVEEKVEVTLSPSPEDVTGAPIHIRGTLDQVRELNGKLFVWDVKTSKRPLWDILHGYTFQLAAYTLGASKLLGRTVEPGGFILTRAYLKRGVDPRSRPDGVFAEVSWTHAHADILLDAVRATVAQIRAGNLYPNPGDHCGYCPARGLDRCLPLLMSLPTV